MKTRPINFKAHEVRAIREGRKTQTRRIIKPQPPFGCTYGINGAGSHAICSAKDNPSVWVPPTPKSEDHRLACPYGKPGDRLYVKERWMNAILPDGFTGAPQVKRGQKSEKLDGWIRVAWHSDSPDPGGWPIRYGWKSPVTMPRWASRITLEIVSVRVERLQDISEADAKREGLPNFDADGNLIHKGWLFEDLWNRINGPGSWDLNPWVWVVEFKEVK